MNCSPLSLASVLKFPLPVSHAKIYRNWAIHGLCEACERSACWYLFRVWDHALPGTPLWKWKHRCFWESFDAKTYFGGCYSCKSNFPRTSKGMKWKTKRIKYDPFSPVFSYCTFLCVKFKLSEILLQRQRATHLPACLVKVGIKRSSYTIMSAFDFYACDITVCFWSHYRCEQLTFYSWLFFCSWSFTDNYFSVDYSHTFIGDTCVTAPVSVSHKL